MTATLYGLRQSVWTERATWALDHHQVPYRYHEHLPFAGELLLRRKAGVKKASVPLYADGSDVVMGSTAIAKKAESRGRGAKLFGDVRVDYWVEVAETIANAGRACFFEKVLASPAAQRELTPAFMPGAIRSLSAPCAAMIIRYLGTKWEVPTNTAHQIATKLRPALEELRNARGARDYLLDGFTFADLTIAATLGAVEPPKTSPLPAAIKDAWTIPALATEYRDVLDWRDEIYARHRTT